MRDNPPLTDLVQFACACGKRLKARREALGKKARCPACGRELLIQPEPAAADLLPAPRHGSRRQFNLGSAVLGALAVLLIAGGITAWIVWPGDEGTGPPGPGGPPPLVPLTDLDLVPPDAVAFVSVRVADLYASPAGQETVKQLTRMGRLQDVHAYLGLTPPEVERLTLVWLDADPAAWVGIVGTKDLVQPPELLRAFPDLRPERVDGRLVYEIGDRDLVLVGPRSYVLGPRRAVRQFFKRPSQTGAPGPLKHALSQADRNPHLLARLAAHPGATWDQHHGLWDFKGASLVGNFGPTSQVDVELTYADAGAARQGERASRAALALVPEHLGEWQGQLARVFGAERVQPFFQTVQVALPKARVQRQGMLVRITIPMATDWKRLGPGFASVMAWLTAPPAERLRI
jgi:hypothetical protein